MVAGNKKSVGSCDFCGSQIPVLDFQEGRASVVSGRTCCACCLESGTWIGSGSKPRGAEPPVCRTQPRFVPSSQFDLALRLPGWRSVFHGNLARQWLDVSGDGLRAVVGRRCAVGDLLLARILHRPTRQRHEIVSTVRNVQESPNFPGCVVAGFQFANASQRFRDLLRDIYGSVGILDAPARAAGKRAGKKIG